MKDFKAFSELFVVELLNELIVVISVYYFHPYDCLQIACINLADFVQAQSCNVHNIFL